MSRPSTLPRRRQAVLHDSQTRHNRGVLLTDLTRSARRSAYLEGVVRDEHELFDQNDLRPRAARLGVNQRIRIFTNRNDFLYNTEDVRWLEQTFGDRLRLFEDGGHLGNLYRPDVKEAIARSIADLVKKPGL